MTQHIAEWLANRGNDTLRDAPLTIQQADRATLQLTFLGAMGPDEHLFRLTAASDTSADAMLRQHFSLTIRESEVLLWIAKGKSNRDIGDILGLSARTVNKHLEQIYVKLGVENRASAAVKAAHILHDT